MEILRKLCALEIKENGISSKTFSFLSTNEKKMLKKNKKYYLKPDKRAKIKVGLAGGVFDILHIGHIFTLSEAKKYCDVLVVVVANDAHIIKKGRTLVHSQEYRVAMVDFLKPVDVAISGEKNYKKTIARVKPDVIIYGYDQEIFLKPAKIKIIKLKKYIEPKKFKSSRIIKKFGL